MYVTRNTANTLNDSFASTIPPSPDTPGTVNSAESQKKIMYGVGGTPLKSQKTFPAAIKKALKDAFPEIWINPEFKNTLDKCGLKQYLLRERPLFRPYQKISAGNKHDLSNREIGKGADSVVIARKNPFASVFVKFSKDHDDYFQELDELALFPSIEELKKRAETLNELAAVFLDDDETTNLMRGHFGIEIMKAIRGTVQRPFPVFYTPAVNGFSLEQYVRDPEKYSEYASLLSGDSLASMMDELGKALMWLHEEGFASQDVKLGNIVFDTENNKLVLVDFEKAVNFSRKMDFEKTVIKNMEWERFQNCHQAMKNSVQ